MSALVKYTTKSSVRAHLRHNTRETKNPSNKDIDPSLTHLNWHLTDPKQTFIAKYSYAHFKQRIKDTYIYNRKDVALACEWVITLPADTPPEQEVSFFKACHDFLNELYTPENNIQAVVHYDEGIRIGGKLYAGRPHMHYMFAPVVPDTNPQHKETEKINSAAFTSRKQLREFHSDLQEYLISRSITGTVKKSEKGKGYTQDYKSVDKLKEQSRLIYALEHIEFLQQTIAELQHENMHLEEQVHSLQEEIEHILKSEELSWYKEQEIEF